MNAAASELDFERAARLRDNIGALKRALEKQTVVFGDGTDADVMSFAGREQPYQIQGVITVRITANHRLDAVVVILSCRFSVK